MNPGKNLIVLSEKLSEQSEKYINRNILHKVAHCYLRHKSLRLDNLSKHETNRQEDEADKLDGHWLSKKSN